MKRIIIATAIILVAVLFCSCEKWREYVPKGDYLWVCTNPDIWFDSSDSSCVLLSGYSGADASFAVYGMPGEMTAADGTKRKIAILDSSVRPFITFYVFEDDQWIEKYSLTCEYKEDGFVLTTQDVQNPSGVYAFLGGEYETLSFQKMPKTD